MNASDIEAIVGTHAPPHPEDVVEEDGGWLTDAETGAVVGHRAYSEHLEIRTESEAAWALRIRGEIERDKLALQAHRKAVCENFDALIRTQERRLSWWNWRLGNQVADFARRALAGGKRRTWTCAWGRVSFRKLKGRTEILDMEAAVEFVANTRPELVRVKKSVGVQDVEAGLAWLGEHIGEEPEKPGWLKHSGESENVTIDTGIHIKKGVDENGDRTGAE